MKTKGIAVFQYHREDDTPSPTYENKLGFFNGARVWLVRRLPFFAAVLVVLLTFAGNFLPAGIIYHRPPYLTFSISKRLSCLLDLTFQHLMPFIKILLIGI
jgi:hypothetical protein